jgi:hypothetical protein
MKVYKNIKLYDENLEDIDLSITKLLEEKDKEKEAGALPEEGAGLTIL